MTRRAAEYNIASDMLVSFVACAKLQSAVSRGRAGQTRPGQAPSRVVAPRTARRAPTLYQGKFGFGHSG